MTIPSTSGERPTHRTVERLSAILTHVARARDGATLTEIARAVDAPVSSVQGFLNGLVTTGFLDERDRRYTLGPAPHLLNVLAGRRSTPQVSHQQLEALSRDSGLTAMLAIGVGGDVYYVDHVSTNPAIAWLAENHVRRSLLHTSSGWVLLADYEERDLWAYLRRLPESDADLIETFLATLPSIRETGICASPKASSEGDGVAVAVTHQGRTVGAVALVGTSEEIDARREALADLLRSHRARWTSS